MKECTLNVKQDYDSEAVKAKVTLTNQHLIIQPIQSTQEKSEDKKEAHSKPKESNAMPSNTEPREQRKVIVKRQTGGGLGISVKGGSEHGIPVLISKVFPGQAADQTHLLYPGDAIIAVNDTVVERMKHDDVVAELRKCGENVTLTVREFDGASHILRTASSSQHNSASSGEQLYVNIPKTNNQSSPPKSSETASKAPENKSADTKQPQQEKHHHKPITIANHNGGMAPQLLVRQHAVVPLLDKVVIIA